jgi:hypothetical protein
VRIPIAAVVLAAWLFGWASAAAVAGSGAAPPSEPPFTADDVIAALNRTLAWYGQARVAMRSLNAATGSVFTRDDEATALAVVVRAFDTARAEAELLKQRGDAPGGVQEHRRRAAEARVELERAITREAQEMDRLQKRLRVAPSRERPELQRELAAAANRLALDDTRRDMFAKFEQFDELAPDVGVDLEQQIKSLAESVPELRSGTAPPPAARATTSVASGTRATVQRLIALQRSRANVEELAQATNRLARTLEADFQTRNASFRSIAARLQALSADPTAEGASLVDGQRTFQELLARAKLLGAILPPLRDESALVRRYGKDLDTWGRALNRDIKDAFQTFAVGLVGVLIAVAAILVGSAVWRVAAVRYVRDAYRRRLVMMARRLVVIVSLGLVIMLHFASELTALVTGLGFAAAGIAFALQNVILAIAGYFSMMTPDDGIRVGDRVSLQGPFGYVHGEVLQIGFVRIRLRELAGDPPSPTGRVVVFPNSVVFTGSFFKHPRTPTALPTQRPTEAA